MDDLTTFLNSVESSARKILKQQNKKHQLQAARDRVALAKRSSQTAALETNGTTLAPTREELRATYASGGALIISVPESPATSNQSLRLLDHNDVIDDGTLPRLPPSRSPVALASPESIHSSSHLPTINQKGKHVTSPSNTPRKRASALKLLESPLYKSLTKLRVDRGGFGGMGASPGQKLKKTLHEVDNVALLLRKMGLQDPAGTASQAHRADHAVEKRMCNACWARPDKSTGCEHHPRLFSTGKSVKSVEGATAALLTSMELQGPTSWLSDDLFVKYRSESDREKVWLAYLELKKQQQELEACETPNAKEHASLVVVPMVPRHPICALFERLETLENLRAHAETHERNLSKTFIFDVNHVWLTNLDHFNHQATRHCILSFEKDQQRERLDVEMRSLSDRRDERAIRDGSSQIQSISSERALQLAVSIGHDPCSQAKLPISTLLMPLTSRSPRNSSRRDDTFCPLSLLVCGRWDPDNYPNVLDRVPGATLVGKKAVLWWKYAPELEESPEYTKVVALFTRNRRLSSSKTLLVILALALDTPLLSPMWFAWHVGSMMPPLGLDSASGSGMDFGRVVSPRSLTLSMTRLESILDDLMPGTITLLNDAAQEDDHWSCVEEPTRAQVGHRRGWSEFSDRHSFRQWLLLTQGRTIAPLYHVVAQYCSVTVAHPNAPGVCGRYCWHDTEPVTKHLCRRRVEKDLLYVIQNHLTSGSNDPTYFSVLMSHETMIDVRGAHLLSYLAMVAEREARAAREEKLRLIEHKLEAGRLVLEAKRQEQKRLEQELETVAAQTEARRKGGIDKKTEQVVEREWAQRLADSIVLEQRGLWEMREIIADASDVVFYRSVNSSLPVARRFLWQPPEEWETKDGENDDSRRTMTHQSSHDAVSSPESVLAKQQANGTAQTELMQSLLVDEHFLQQLKIKLGLSLQSQPSTTRTGRRGLDVEEHHKDENNALVDLDDGIAALNDVDMDRSRSIPVASTMTKLRLMPPTTCLPVGHRGEGWKRLKTSRLAPNFARSVYTTHTEGPRSSFINQLNDASIVGMLDPAKCSPYTPPDFIPKLRVHFMPRPLEDLQEKKVQMAMFLRSHQTIATPNTSVRRGAVSVAERESIDTLLEHGAGQQNETREQLQARALLCARSNNLKGLELLLDQGIDVNTRDHHGNTLFILACQQGNKRLAKLLLRRHADLNLPNLSGNTALHYLYAYKHEDLAEYLKGKGAKDTTQNGAGLTCYEGLSQDDVDSI